MKRLTLAAIAVIAFSPLALADTKPSADEAKKIADAAAVFGCTGGEAEKEDEASGLYELDDAKCKDGQFDLKFDKDFKLMGMSRD